MIKHAEGISFRKSVVISVLLAVVTGVAGASVPATRAPSPPRPISARLPVLPLVFEPNVGQTDSSVRFVARVGGYTVFLTGEGAVLNLRGAEPVRVRPACAQTPAAVEGLEPTGGTSNYFKGADSSRWKTGIPNYRRVRYTGACPGVDVTYYGNPQRLEYDFLLAPGTNPDTVRVEYDGVKSLRIAANGDLVLKTGAGDLVQPRPHVYQEIGGRRVVVEAGYRLAGKHGVKFALAGYRRDVPLVIDPVLVYSTYIGGSLGDAGTAIAVDASGNAYVTGQTLSLDFPIFGAVQPSNGGGGNSDAFAMKISADGQTRLYSTYLGSAGQDFGSSIAVDGSGNAYIAGATTSPTFPTVNAIQTYQGFTDGFVTKLNSTGSSLLYSTYLGGALADQITGIAVDSTGNAYVAGWTNSYNFPFTPGAFQTSNQGTENAFVAKLSPTGNSLVYSTLLGGNAFDLASAIAVDGSGNAYVTGFANSANFPVTGGALQTANAGGSDAFVTKLNASGNALLYSTFFGGAGTDNATGIRVDGSGNAYIAGTTSSTALPMLNAAQGTYGGGTSDAFIAKLNSTGSGLLFSTFLGGSGAETAAGIAIDGSGNSYVTGQTGSANFPAVSALYFTGGTFVTALGSSGNALLYSTRLTGDAADSGGGIAVDANGSVYVTGSTTSTNFPIQSPLQATNHGQNDAFLAKLSTGGLATSRVGVFDSGLWFLANDAGGIFKIIGFGPPASTPVTGDWDGTGTAKVGVFDHGLWYLANSAGGIYKIIGFGSPTSIPVVGDWDGNGTTNIGVFDHGLWYLANDAGGIYKVIGFGQPTSTPVVGDWDGNGTTNIGVFDHGLWFLANDAGGIYKVIGFGQPTATPVVGDWDGTGTAKIGVFDHGLWFLANSAGGIYKIIGFGQPTSKPLVGDWDGNGTANIAVFDNGLWFLANDSGGIYKIIGFGQPNSTPVAGRW